METKGDRIRRLRLARDMTQQELADEVGVTREAVSQWESGETKDIKNETFALVCRVLGTTADYLIFGPDERKTGRFRRRRPAKGSDNKA